jgi:hypothetical protein
VAHRRALLLKGERGQPPLLRPHRATAQKAGIFPSALHFAGGFNVAEQTPTLTKAQGTILVESGRVDGTRDLAGCSVNRRKR